MKGDLLDILTIAATMAILLVLFKYCGTDPVKLESRYTDKPVNIMGAF